MAKLTKKKLLHYFYYMLGGSLYFWAGYGIFSTLYGIFHWPWLFAKMCGDAVGLSINFVIQHHYTFAEHHGGRRRRHTLKKYTPLSIFNIFLDYGLVGGLNHAGLSPFISPWISAGFFTIWNYLLYKYWVFAPKKTATVARKKSSKKNRS